MLKHTRHETTRQGFLLLRQVRRFDAQAARHSSLSPASINHASVRVAGVSAPAFTQSAKSGQSAARERYSAIRGTFQRHKSCKALFHPSPKQRDKKRDGDNKAWLWSRADQRQSPSAQYIHKIIDV